MDSLSLLFKNFIISVKYEYLKSYDFIKLINMIKYSCKTQFKKNALQKTNKNISW